jgi:hypothetical protein
MDDLNTMAEIIRQAMAEKIRELNDLDEVMKLWLLATGGLFLYMLITAIIAVISLILGG